VNDETTGTGKDRLVVTGLAGLLRGESIEIEVGASAVLGRSRSCDHSMRRSRRFLASPAEEQRRMLADRGFNRVSRRHVRVSFPEPGRIVIEDLSRNGTWLNGSRIETVRLNELPPDGVEILLAGTESLSLSRVTTNGRPDG